MSSNGERPGREVAYRLFAAEYDDATLSHAESDEERAPNYVITPTGARINRLFVVGTLTEVTRVNDEMVRARVVDPTGAFVVYAGQYQPDELATLERLDPPEFVAVTGKARTFQPDDSDAVYTSIRPESVATVDGDTRDRWVVDAAARTADRVGAYAAAAELDATDEDLTEALVDAGVDPSLASGIPLAQRHYATTPAYLEALVDLAHEATEVVAGERDQVSRLDRQPGDGDPDATGFAALADAGGVNVASAAPAAPAASDDVATADADEPAVDSSAAAESVAAESNADAATVEADADTDDIVSEPAGDDASDADTAVDVDTTADGDTSDTGTTDDDDAPGEAPADSAAADGADSELGDFESGGLDEGMYEMDAEEREQIEEEFGAEFTTGTEVDDPGEADIDVPESESADDEETDETADEDEGTEEDEPDGGADEPSADDEPSKDVDLQAYVVETMTDLDEGDGADRTAVVETVAADAGVSEDEVEEAIQDALMGGQCFEPDDETLKAI